MGIGGKVIEATHVLRDGDRVEILRPLELDPREARRRRASTGRGARKR
jgi:putative ubiquitin-RnfH superfamily antitoxin RatB of RatAB toxin-antitoxin module